MATRCRHRMTSRFRARLRMRMTRSSSRTKQTRAHRTESSRLSGKHLTATEPSSGYRQCIDTLLEMNPSQFWDDSTIRNHVSHEGACALPKMNGSCTTRGNDSRMRYSVLGKARSGIPNSTKQFPGRLELTDIAIPIPGKVLLDGIRSRILLNVDGSSNNHCD